jgi:hypothetical protein
MLRSVRWRGDELDSTSFELVFEKFVDEFFSFICLENSNGFSSLFGDEVCPDGEFVVEVGFMLEKENLAFFGVVICESCEEFGTTNGRS